MATINIYGIRHHGPGSARSVRRALEQFQPDAVVIEGPSDADFLIPMLTQKKMKPPVALLAYSADDPQLASYFPFAKFSPEFQAIAYANQCNVDVRFMDLPQKYAMPFNKRVREEALEKAKAQLEKDVKALLPQETESTESHPEVREDPLRALAHAAGYEDPERWWDALVEQRQDDRDLFEALIEVMGAARDELGVDNPMENLREAYMRQTIRQTIAEKYEKVAVVCGAWHAPVLRDLSEEERDKALLADLEEIEVAATWIPWTYSRLAKRTGYGAGITSPGWYDFVWEHEDAETLAIGWLTIVAQRLRDHDLIASTAQVIDAVRLAETLAAMRERAFPDLHDLNEVTLSVLCHGNPAPMQIVLDDLIVGEAMGSVPDNVPKVTLQRDFELTIELLELKLKEEENHLLLDLRNERGRQISRLLHRLTLLEIGWGELTETTIKSETWVLKWEPVLFIQLIEKSPWGSTILEAAENYALDTAHKLQELPPLTYLVKQVLLAELPNIVSDIVKQLRDQAATAREIVQLMGSLLPLVEIVVYGDIRRQHQEAVAQVVDTISTRIIIGLPSACMGLDDDNAEKMLASLIQCDWALRLLDDETKLNEWRTMLGRLVTGKGVHGLIRGRCARIVTDAHFIEKEATVQQMRLALNNLLQPEDAAAWLRGFLFESGIILVHDDFLLSVMDDWVATLTPDAFEAVLPLVRRTFGTFEYGEVRHVAARVEGRPVRESLPKVEVDPELDEAIDDTLSALLGGIADDNA